MQTKEKGVRKLYASSYSYRRNLKTKNIQKMSMRVSFERNYHKDKNDWFYSTETMI